MKHSLSITPATENFLHVYFRADETVTGMCTGNLQQETITNLKQNTLL